MTLTRLRTDNRHNDPEEATRSPSPPLQELALLMEFQQIVGKVFGCLCSSKIGDGEKGV